MTDLKPEDRDIEKRIADLTNLATLAGDETFPLGRLVTSAKRKKLSEDLFVARSLLADRARIEKAAALLERVVIYQIEDDDRIHISVAGQHLEGFDPSSLEAQALLRFDAEQRDLRKGASQ